MISIVIPNYNSGELLKKNLPKLIELLKKSKLKYEIIISDDCSTDDSYRLLTHTRPPLVCVWSEKNTGFGSTVDRGIKAAKGEIVFILNAADLLPESSDYFSLVLKHFEDPNVFSVAAAKKDETGIHGSGEIYFSKGFFLHKHRVIATQSEAKGKQSSLVQKQIAASPSAPRNDVYTDWADGGAQAIRKEYYEKIGGFDPKYFLYWEDVDLGSRAWKAGYKIIYEPKAVLIHQKHEGPIAKKYSPKEIKILNLKAQYYFTWKNSNFSQKLQFLFWQPYHLAVALRNEICKLP